MKAHDLVSGHLWAIAEASFGPFAEWADSAEIAPESLAAFQGRPLDGTSNGAIRDGVATLPIRGMIVRHDTPLTRFLASVFGGSITDILAADFNAAARNPDVRQILLQVDSPGGHAAGIGELAEMIHSSPKPVVAYVGSQGSSAAYYLASAAGSVVVDRSALVGSIGTVMGMHRRKPSDPIEIVSSQSPNKRADVETDAGREQMQSLVDSMTDVFLADVARFRGTTPDRVASEFGRGGQMVGKQAVDAGMADEVGSFEQTLNRMRRGEVLARRPMPKCQAPSNPKEPAMSEPTTTPAAGDQGVITMSASDHAAFLKRVADSEAAALADREAKAAQLTRSIDIEARAFATEVITGQCKAVPAERQAILDVMSLALRDDHDHPVAGSPTARADAIRAIYEKRTAHTLTRERGSADPSASGRALASDPASDAHAADPEAAAAARAAQADRERRKKANQAALGKMAAAE